MGHSGPDPDWQERTIQLLGEKKFARLQDANVLVVGMGGVGSMAAEMICRSGIGKMCIIDGDTVLPGNINRQLPATHGSLDRKKAVVMGERLKDINPGLELTVFDEFIREKRIKEILQTPFDYVVDAIDTLSPTAISHPPKICRNRASFCRNPTPARPRTFRIQETLRKRKLLTQRRTPCYRSIVAAFQKKVRLRGMLLKSNWRTCFNTRNG